jgi:hypothetical protein
MGYQEGADLGLDFKYPFQHFNRMKNHWRVSDPVTALFDAQPGMIASDPDDEKLWHFTGASPGSDEILQANFSHDSDVQFNEIIAHGDVKTEAYNRKDTIIWNDCFDWGIGTQRYQWTWDITSLNTSGNGTNTIDTNPSHITLTTSALGIGDNEGTRTEFEVILRSRRNRSCVLMELGQTANTQFYFGWNISGTNAIAGGGEYVLVWFDKSINNNWNISVNDGGGEDTYDSGVVADTDEIIHDIWTELDGTIHWSINGWEVPITGIANKMTASAHYLIVGQAQSVTGAAVIVAEIDYVENEKYKIH